MSVSVEVCKDIEQFQETVVAGMDAKHTVFAIAGIAVGSITGGICHLVFHLSNAVTMYAVMFAAIPVIFIGFLDKDGMGIIERLKRSRALKNSHVLYNISTESPEYFQKLMEKERLKEKARGAGSSKSTADEMKKQMQMVLLAGSGSVLLIIAVIVAIILLK